MDINLQRSPKDDNAANMYHARDYYIDCLYRLVNCAVSQAACHQTSNVARWQLLK